MNKKIIGIIAVIVAVVVAVVCIVALGDKDTDSKKDNDKKTEAGENHVALDPSERNARAKTCCADQRELVAVLNNYTLYYNENDYSGTISYNSDGENHSDFQSDIDALDEETFCSLFQHVPVCPACGSYKITFTPVDEEGYSGPKITVECIDNVDGYNHQYNSDLG